MAQSSPLMGPSATPGAMSLPGEAPGEAPAPPTSPPSFTEKMLSQAQGRFDATKKATTQLGRIQSGLAKLAAKGDSVTSDDVLDEMATLVAHGADPKNLAAMVAGNTQAGVNPMPPGGEPLAGWLRNVEESIIAPAEAQLWPAMALAQHQLGVAAMHRMVDLHAKAAGGAQGGASGAPAPDPLGASTQAPPATPSLLQ